MTNWEKMTLRERKEEAENRMPPLLTSDNKKINLRKVFVERAMLGIHRVTDNQLYKIGVVGYDVYLINKINSSSYVGTKMYRQLVSIGRFDLTNEYIGFHFFRKKLKQEKRVKIAKLMANYFSKNPNEIQRTAKGCE